MSVLKGPLRVEKTERAWHSGMIVDGDDCMPSLVLVVESHEELRARVETLEKAIAWALGEGDDFPPRMEGQGAFWWRTELRRLSGEPRGGGAHE